MILYQFIQLFPRSHFSHMFSLYSHGFSGVVFTNLCHVQWHGASHSTLPLDEAHSQWRANFSSPTGDSLFSDDFLHSFSLRFASLTSLRDSGRYDAPFSYNELVAALSKCHEVAPGADGLSYSLFKVSFPWWRHFCFPSSTSSCASLWFRPLGSPASSSQSSSAMVTPPPLIPIVLFLSRLAHSNSSST